MDSSNHKHEHAHHHHEISGAGRALYFSLFFTILIFVLELIGGYFTRSLALLSDAWHVASDALALGLGCFAKLHSEKPRDLKKTFGYKRVEVLSGLVNGTTLIVVSIFIIFEAIGRFIKPQDIKLLEASVISTVGLVANLIIAFILNPHKEESINIKGAFLHVLGDALASVGVIIGLLVIYYTGIRWVDPLVAVVICFYLLYEAFKLAKESIHILFEGSPLDFDIASMIGDVKQLPNVADVHDVHVWTISGSDIYVSMHVVVERGEEKNRPLLDKIESILHKEYNVNHLNVQIEEECSQGNGIVCCE
ncbi:MAG: CDF family zinc efflux transporter CzrB [bacterium]